MAELMAGLAGLLCKLLSDSNCAEALPRQMETTVSMVSICHFFACFTEDWKAQRVEARLSCDRFLPNGHNFFPAIDQPLAGRPGFESTERAPTRTPPCTGGTRETSSPSFNT